jgi:hypothetical protein
MDNELIRGAGLHEQFLRDSMEMDRAYLKGDLQGFVKRYRERAKAELEEITIEEVGS